MASNTDEYEEIVALLRKEIKAKDHDIYLAATYGKQLLDEKEVINNKLHKAENDLEKLEQEKYSLQLGLETKTQTINTQASELELLSGEVSCLQKRALALEKENISVKEKFDNLLKKKLDFESIQEDLQLENSSLKNKIKLLEKQIETFQNVTICNESIQEDIPDINLYINKIKNLEDNLADTQCELESFKLKEKRLTSLVKELEEAVADRDKEISSHSTEIKQAQDFAAELQCEIEMLKLDQLDVNRRGNSMFAELDDRRKLVESEYKLLSKKYDNVLRNYEENKIELTRCKGQMAILSSMTSKKYQDTYIEKLENMLSEARREKKTAILKLGQIMKNQQQISAEKTDTVSDQYNYLRVMNQLADQKIKKMENDLISARMQILNLENNLSVSERDLYISKRDYHNLKIENLKLKQDIKDLTVKPDSDVPVKPKINVEIMPGFENDPECQKLYEKTLKENLEPKKQDNILTGEHLLGGKGFFEMNGPRIPTVDSLKKAQLQKKEIEEANNQDKKYTLKELDQNIKDKSANNQQLSSESRKKVNNCAQQ